MAPSSARPLFVLQRRLAQAAAPVGSIGALGDARRRGQHAVELGHPARVGVGISLHQAAAADHLDREVVIRGPIAQRGGQPAVQMRAFLLVAQGVAAPAPKAAQQIQQAKPDHPVGAQPPPAPEQPAQPFHPARAGLQALAQTRGQQARHLLGAGVHELGQVQVGGVGGLHLLPDPGKTRGAGLQVGHPDHVIVRHGVRDVFRRLAAEGMVAGGVVLAQDRVDPVQVFGAIGDVLIIHHLAQAGARHRRHRRGQGGGTVGQRLPAGQQRGGAGDGLWPWRGNGRGDNGPVAGGGKGAQRPFHPLAARADRVLIRPARERQRAGTGQRAQQRGGNHRSLRLGQRLIVGGDHPACGDPGGGQHLLGRGNAVARGGFLGHRQRAVGRCDQRCAVGGDKTADDGAPRLHHFRRDQAHPHRPQQASEKTPARARPAAGAISTGSKPWPRCAATTPATAGCLHSVTATAAGHILDPPRPTEHRRLARPPPARQAS